MMVTVSRCRRRRVSLPATQSASAGLSNGANDRGQECPERID